MKRILLLYGVKCEARDQHPSGLHPVLAPQLEALNIQIHDTPSWEHLGCVLQLELELELEAELYISVIQ